MYDEKSWGSPVEIGFIYSKKTKSQSTTIEIVNLIGMLVLFFIMKTWMICKHCSSYYATNVILFMNMDDPFLYLITMYCTVAACIHCHVGL